MNSLNDIWSSVLAVLGQNLTATALNTWFDDCTPVEIVNNRLVIHTPTEFKRDIIQTRFAQTIVDALSDIFSAEFKLTILAGDELDSYISETRTDDTLPEVAGFTFDNFVVGPSNKYAHAAAVAVAENPGKLYNPLFIYGNSGLGKTHLLLAIGQAIRERDPSTKIAYVKGEEFTNQLMKALRDKTNEEFRMKYRNVDLFLVDDIQFISGKQATQEEFFHTFNNIYEAGHQIVITSDRPPIDMSVLDDRLRSRFEGGLMADIQPPDLETRMVITRAKAAQLGLIIEDDAVNYIAETLSSNVRQIEGVVKRLTAYKEILGKKIDTADVKRAIADVTKNGSYIPSPQRIIHETARFFSLSEQDIRGQNRSKSTAFARQVSMYLIRTLTNLPLKEIGGEYEGRNHSTVLSSIKKIEDLIRTDKAVADTVRDITSNINSD